MKILGLDSSGIVASVAIVEEDNLIAEYTVNYKKTHSQTLLPMLDELAKMTELDMDTIDAIAVAAGPGSFTGLRIGSATAKGLGLALKKPLVEIPTVDALAYNLYDAKALICPIMDARRSQVYTGIYRFEKKSSAWYLPFCKVKFFHEFYLPVSQSFCSIFTLILIKSSVSTGSHWQSSSHETISRYLCSVGQPSGSSISSV